MHHVIRYNFVDIICKKNHTFYKFRFNTRHYILTKIKYSTLFIYNSQWLVNLEAFKHLKFDIYTRKLKTLIESFNR